MLLADNNRDMMVSAFDHCRQMFLRTRLGTGLTTTSGDPGGVVATLITGGRDPCQKKVLER